MMGGTGSRSREVMNNALRFFSPTHGRGSEADEEELEFEELEIWGCQPETRVPVVMGRKPITISRAPLPRKKGDRLAEETAGGGPSSLPMTIPDWSKILRQDQEEEVEDDDELIIPPHEVVGLTRKRWISRLGMGESFSFSMEEGIGRTLKGRDLSRVRNAIWEKIGFQD